MFSLRNSIAITVFLVIMRLILGSWHKTLTFPGTNGARRPRALQSDMTAAEQARRQALRRLDLLDTSAEQSFDRVTKLAQRVFGTPIALVALIDDHRQWFKSKIGLSIDETPREQALCAMTADANAPLVIPDTREDRRSADNPLVTGPPGIRFYAGAPVHAPDGTAIGSLCVIDTEPRASLSRADRDTLVDLAGIIDNEIAARARMIREIEAQTRTVRELTDRLDTVAKAAPLAIVTLDGDGRVSAWNRVAERIFGWPAREAIGQPAPFPTEPDAATAPAAAERPEDPGIQSLRTRQTTRRGDTVDLAIVSAALSDGDGQPGGRLVLVEDVSARTALAAELETALADLAVARDDAKAASRAKSDFLAKISHELRTPLNAIIGFSGILADPDTLPSDQATICDYATDIQQGAQHLLSVISNLLDLTRADSGRLPLTLDEVQPADPVRRAVRMVSHRANEKDVAIDVYRADAPPRLVADETKLNQALLNVVENAVKFTPTGGRVYIAVETAGTDTLDISVTDAGIGMSAEECARALEPFGQAQRPHTRDHDGIGLGLPLARRLVELHGGRLLVDSTPGRGTRVTLRLPLEPDADADAGTGAPGADPAETALA
jgi:PAS domain S-box-containing protein